MVRTIESRARSGLPAAAAAEAGTRHAVRDRRPVGLSRTAELSIRPIHVCLQLPVRYSCALVTTAGVQRRDRLDDQRLEIRSLEFDKCPGADPCHGLATAGRLAARLATHMCRRMTWVLSLCLWGLYFLELRFLGLSFRGHVFYIGLFLMVLAGFMSVLFFIFYFLFFIFHALPPPLFSQFIPHFCFRGSAGLPKFVYLGQPFPLILRSTSTRASNDRACSRTKKQQQS